MIKKFFKRLFAPTPEKNKTIGRWFTVISAKLVLVEGVLLTYNIDTPKWFEGIIIVSAIGCALFAGHNGIQTKEPIE